MGKKYFPLEKEAPSVTKKSTLFFINIIYVHVKETTLCFFKFCTVLVLPLLPGRVEVHEDVVEVLAQEVFLPSVDYPGKAQEKLSQ